MLRSITRVLTVLAACGLCASVHGQCGHDFAYGFHMPGVSHGVNALMTFDDGSGEALYAGGWFQTAGEAQAPYIARWNGVGWSAVGEGLNDAVHCFAIFDDGSGPALYAGGRFTFSGQTPINRVAKWDGESWSNLGGGVNGDVLALTVFDDGSGPALYAGGESWISGGLAAHGMAKWDGTSWTNFGLGTGGSGEIHAMQSFDDDGEGPNPPALYVGGSLTWIGGMNSKGIAKWNGSSWSSVGNGISTSTESFNVIDCLAVFDEDGAGAGLPVLFAGGSFWMSAAEAMNIARWNGSAWSKVVTTGSFATRIFAMLPVDDPGLGISGLVLAGNEFDQFGWSYRKVALWTGAEVVPICDEQFVLSSDDEARALQVFDDGSGGGPRLLVGGDFERAGNHDVRHVAALQNSQWHPLDDGSGLDVVRALKTIDLGDGPHVYAREGRFVSRLQDGAWVQIGNQLSFNQLSCIEYFDLGEELYSTLYTTSGGKAYQLVDEIWEPIFSLAWMNLELLLVLNDGGGPSLHAIHNATNGTQSALVKHNPQSNSWSQLGPTLFGGKTLCVAQFDDGSGNGPELYAAGSFASLQDGTPMKRIAKWTGETWTEVGGGTTQPITGTSIHAMQVFDDGTGPALYVGGFFRAIGGVPAQNVAKWDGKSWSALGEGLPGTFWSPAVRMLTVFDDGTGPALYASGQSLLGGLFKWNGANWEQVAGWFDTTQDYASCAAVIEEASGPALFIGGSFFSVDGVPSANIAKYEVTANPPIVQSQPIDRAVSVGQDATFTAEGWGGEISYQWRKDGVALNDSSHVSGANSSTLTIMQVVDEDAGSYDVQVVSDCGSTLSVAATLTITCPFDIVPDAIVDVDDLLVLINAWGACEVGVPCPADLAPPGPPPGNGVVNVDDLLAVINAWGECP